MDHTPCKKCFVSQLQDQQIKLCVEIEVEDDHDKEVGVHNQIFFYKGWF